MAQNRSSQAEAPYRQGLAALHSGDLVKARAAFEQVVKLAPGSAEGHNLLGWVLLAQEHSAESISQFRIALRLKPDFAQAHMNLANALVKSGDLTGAESEARAAIRLAPNDAEAHRTLGRIASFRADLATASAELGKAVDLKPERADLRDELGSVLAQRSQLDEAATQFSEALRLAARLRSGCPASRRGALAAEKDGRSSQSAATGGASSPQSAQAHYYLGRVLDDIAQRDRAS